MCKLFIEADPALWESSTKSLRIDGMVTSVRLETFFWSVLEEIAARDGMNVVQLITKLHHESIDAGHDLGNFTSFCVSAVGATLPCNCPEMFPPTSGFRSPHWTPMAFWKRKVKEFTDVQLRRTFTSSAIASDAVSPGDSTP